MRLKQRGDERRNRRNVAAALVLAPVLCLAGVGSSCGTDEDTAHVVETDTRDDGESGSGDGEAAQQQTDDPPVELVRVPDVIGLSSSEAHTRLEAAGFTVAAGLHDIPKAGVQSDTVTGADPIPGTPAPFGSQVVLDIYFDNATGDESVMTTEDFARIRIKQEVEAEFGDRVAMGYWDKTTAIFNVRIADLSAEEVERLQSRYNDEAFTVVISAAAIGHADLRALNQSTKDLVRAFLLNAEYKRPTA